MKRRSKAELLLVSELIKNCRRSDRELAKVIGVSQPTVTRSRVSVEREGLVDYTAVPNFGKLGFEIMVFSFYSWRPEANEKLVKNSDTLVKKLSEFLEDHKNIIFTSNGQGLGMERMMISVHKSYGSYVKLMKDVRQEWGEYLSSTNSFIISFKGDIVGRELSFRHFADFLLTEH